jgi:Family of unknown function (DUF6069)
MTDLDATTGRHDATSRAVVVLAAVAAAVAVNLLLYAAGRLAGGDFSFSQGGSTARVDAITVAGFSAVPLGLGLTVVGLLARRLPWIARVAIVAAPVLAIATIGIMTIPVDLDTISTVALATCHLTLVPISIVAIRRLRP